MHMTVQPDGRCPKPMSGPMSTSQLKSVSGNVRNTGASLPPPVRGKKRVRRCRGLEPIKRGRSSKVDADFVSFTAERILKTEIVKITDGGGLVDVEGVEKLLQLMLPKKSDRKLDLACRSSLANVIATSDNFDCLCRFVQLNGLPVLDEWLQDVHKGKSGDGSSSKDNEKSVEDFLLVMLLALEKLPVNLNALRTCNIGKSVNHLRTHKNSEIQRKARSLVDTWKKRVEAEMNSHDMKFGSIPPVPWTNGTRHAEFSHGGNKPMPGPSESAIKSSLTQVSVSRGNLVIPSLAEAVKSAAASEKINSKDGLHRVAAVCGASDPPQTEGREEKSSSSSQSHNNGLSCSSDCGRTLGFQGKEDTRSSTAGSMSVNKLASAASRHQISGVQNESESSRSSFNRNTAPEKMSLSGLTSDKISERPVAEGSNHKLIVKIPNRSRSPPQSVGTGVFEDPSVLNGQASSPVCLVKHNSLDHNLKEKGDSSRANINSDVKSESWQSNDFKDVLSDEGVSPAAVPDDERHRTGDDSKMPGSAKAASSISGSESKTGKLHERNTINALIESCVKYSEASASISVGDDVGMNLLASVAAEEILKSDSVLPRDSPLISSSFVVDNCKTNETKQNPSDRGDAVLGLLIENSTDHNEHRTAGLCSETYSKADNVVASASASAAVSAACSMEKEVGTEKGQRDHKTKAVLTGVNAGRTPDSKLKVSCAEEIVDNLYSKTQYEKELVEGLSSSLSSLKIEGGVKKIADEGLISGIRREQKPPNAMINPDSPEKANEEVPLCSVSGLNSSLGKLDEHRAGNSDEMGFRSHVEQENNVSPTCKNSIVSCLGSSVADDKSTCAEENVKNKDVIEHHSRGPASQTEHVKFIESKLIAAKVEKTEECASTTADVSLFSDAGGSEMDKKMDFDLNEGFNVDDGKCTEPINLVPTGCAAPVNVVSPLPFPVSSVSKGPSSITVAAATKGSFLPPKDLLSSKGELGWKGSAATSAFRPAEPRKVLEMSLGLPGASLLDTAPGKKSRLPLDIDLNVADERIFEDICSVAGTSNYHNPSRDSAPTCSSGGLDFDLNRVDQATDVGQCSKSNGHRLHAPLLSVNSSASGRYSNGEVSFRGNLDLNNGPGLDETNVEPSLFGQHARSSIPAQTPVAYIRMNSGEVGSFSSWFPPGNTYSAVTIPSFLPERGDQSFPIVNAGGGPPRLSGAHRGQVLSSSLAGSFPLTQFQYPVFPFGTNFAMPSATSSVNSTYMDPSSAGRFCFPAIHTQLLGPAGPASSEIPRPYIVGLPDGVAESSQKWGAQGLDLNAGPAGSDMEVRDKTLRVASKLSIADSQTLATEQARMYQVAGSSLKRKGPEGTRDAERFRYKQSSWQ